MTGSNLELAALTKLYGSTVAVDAIDLKVAANSYCCLLGPSGCGKTSTLRLVAGHETASSGDIILLSAGTFAGPVDVENKDITILGANHGHDSSTWAPGWGGTSRSNALRTACTCSKRPANTPPRRSMPANG